MKKIFFIFVISLLFSLAAFAQSPQPSATPPVNEDEDIVKISTTLIQLDVVVTDKNGNLVTGLKPEDFEVMENGEQQTITGLSYFSGQKTAPENGGLNANVPGAMPTVGEVRRTLAIVVDDAGMSSQSLTALKKDLTQFVNEQMQPNDLVAIIRTSRSVGIFQQFTTDKKKLLAAIENLRFQPSTASPSIFEPIGVSFAERVAENNGIAELTQQGKSASGNKNDIESLVELNRNLTVTTGSLGVLNLTISAMGALPGRKSVLYAAEGVYGLIIGSSTTNVTNLGGTASIFADVKKLRDQLRGITEVANRSTIAIYTLDVRGTVPINFGAADEVRGGMTDRELRATQESRGILNGGGNESDLTRRGDSLKTSQEGFKFLSEETSGKAFLNSNDLGKGLRETLDSQNGYYIVAYQPNAETFDPDKRRFNKLTVKVKRPNVNVSYRSGFFNVAEDAGKKTESPDRAFAQKVYSPYKSTEINLRMTSVYIPDEQTSTVRSFVSINPKDLQFADSANGDKTAQFDLIAVAFDEDGIPIAEVGKIFQVKASPQRYAELLKSGINYNLTFATKTRGAQQIKVSVRDQNTQRVGTASQNILVPNFGKQPVALSGILFANYTPQEFKDAQSGKAPTDAATRTAANTASRRFKKGTILSFSYAVYVTSPVASKAQTQFVVLKDGKEIFKGAMEDFPVAESAGKVQRINRSGAFVLGTDMAAGQYILQVTVSGDAVKEPQMQQIDFDLEN